MAACVNRAPEGTFGAAVAEVGVLDLLKVLDLDYSHRRNESDKTCYGQFADFTIGMSPFDQ